MSLKFSNEAVSKLEVLFERYPSKQPALLAALHLAQKEFGDLRDEALAVVAEFLDLSKAHVYGVATFYTMFNLEPVGEFFILTGQTTNFIFKLSNAQ